ncbi:MAG: hypothetical protein L0154_18490 [Chloroflexi bacterium]|nr:hypothetical protein [Chloroflexota bacterium]
MHKSILIISVFLWIWNGIGPVQGQDARSHTALLISGTYSETTSQRGLFRFVDGAWEQVPVDNFYRGAISPDGQWLAYLSMPPFLQDIEGGPDFWTGTAWDIQLLDLQTMSTTPIAVQPDSITVTDNGYRDGIKRSIPVWSPDGSAVAWTEQDYPARDTARLMIYDPGNNTSSVLDDALPQMRLSADGLPHIFAWGMPGIVVFTNDPVDSTDILRFYDETTGLGKSVQLPGEEADWPPLAGPLWITQVEAAGDVVGVQSSDNAWYIIDPLTGEIGNLGTQLEGVTASSLDDSIRLVWNVHAQESEPVWQFQSAEGSEMFAAEGVAAIPLHRITIAPSGDAAAYLQANTIHLWQDQILTQIEPPEDLRVEAIYWGQIQWQTGSAYDDVG